MAGCAMYSPPRLGRLPGLSAVAGVERLAAAGHQASSLIIGCGDADEILAGGNRYGAPSGSSIRGPKGSPCLPDRPANAGTGKRNVIEIRGDTAGLRYPLSAAVSFLDEPTRANPPIAGRRDRHRFQCDHTPTKRQWRSGSQPSSCFGIPHVSLPCFYFFISGFRGCGRRWRGLRTRNGGRFPGVRIGLD